MTKITSILYRDLGLRFLLSPGPRGLHPHQIPAQTPGTVEGWNRVRFLRSFCGCNFSWKSDDCLNMGHPTVEMHKVGNASE